MSQELCHLIVDQLINAPEISDMAVIIGSGLRSGQGIWQLMMDNPIVFGMVLGGACATFLRRWFWGRRSKSR
jgi:hypothetical protein